MTEERFSQLQVISAKRPQETGQSCNCISFSAKLRISVLEKDLGITGPERGSDSPKVTQQTKTRNGLQTRDLSIKSLKNKAIQTQRRHLSPAIPYGRGGLHSLTIMPSSSLSSLPHSLPKGPVSGGPGSPQGLQWEPEPPEVETEPEIHWKRGGATGGWSA